MAADPACTVFTTEGKTDFETMSEGIAFAEKETARLAESAARTSGASAIVLNTEKHEKSYSAAIDENSHIVLEVEIVTSATGKPDLGSLKKSR